MVRATVRTTTVPKAPFAFSEPRPVNSFFFGFWFHFHHHHGFGHCFGFPFCCSAQCFGFSNCFGNPFFSPFFLPFGTGFSGGIFLGDPFFGHSSGLRTVAPQGQVEAYEPPSESGRYMPDALTPAVPEEEEAPKQVTLLALKDGTMYGITDYWLDHGQLHYVTSYGGGNALPLHRVDLDKTVQLNSAMGIDFVLRDKPSRQRAPAPPLSGTFSFPDWAF